jgi:hypothetical protein
MTVDAVRPALGDSYAFTCLPGFRPLGAPHFLRIYRRPERKNPMKRLSLLLCLLLCGTAIAQPPVTIWQLEAGFYLPVERPDGTLGIQRVQIVTPDSPIPPIPPPPPPAAPPWADVRVRPR